MSVANTGNFTDIKFLTNHTYKGGKKVRPGLDTLFNAGQEEKAQFEESAQFTISMLRNLLQIRFDFERNIKKTVEAVLQKKPADNLAILTDVEGEYIKLIRSALQKIINILSNLRVYEESNAAFDLLLKPSNALVSNVLNMKPKYELSEPIAKYVDSNMARFSTTITSLLTNIRGLIATHLYHRQVQKMSKTVVSKSSHNKKWKTIKVLASLQKYLLDKTQTVIIMKGQLLKKSSNSKNWKKYFFVLEYERILYSEKETDLKSAKIVFTNTLTGISDVTDEIKKAFSFQINCEQPIVLCAPNEKEFRAWIDELNQVIARNQIAPDNSAQEDLQPDYTIFTEAELFNMARSLDKEEKYHTEVSRLIHLAQMSGIAKQINPSSTSEWDDPDREKKIQEYKEKKLNQQKYSIFLAKDNPQLLQDIQKEPTDYLSILSGFGPRDFEM